jgi:hypothetical protein
MDRKGQVLVELAIVLPLAFFILFILAELAFMYNAKQVAMLSAFKSARSFIVNREKAKAETCMHSALQAVTFKEPVDKVACLFIQEGEKGVLARVVYLYKPLFPIFPLAEFLGGRLFSDDHTEIVERAVQQKSGWPEMVKRRVPITGAVEICQ